MKLKTLTALSVPLFLYSVALIAPVAYAATTAQAGNASASADQSTRPPSLTVVTGVNGGHTIQSSPLALLKVNGAEGAAINNSVNNMAGIARHVGAAPLREVNPAANSTEPGTLAMLLTGLGVMGSIARRRRLAKKAA